VIGQEPNQEGAATDACPVGEDISEFHGVAGREMLAGFEENSENEHRKTHYDSSAFIPESDHWQGRQRQVGAEVLHFVVDVQAADGGHYGRRGWEQ
jgi:hypothetical protein